MPDTSTEPRQGQLARLAALALLAALGSTALAADPPPGTPSASESGATRPAGETAAGSSPRPSSEGSAAEPIEPFVPSESISADSAVAFPVDI